MKLAHTSHESQSVPPGDLALLGLAVLLMLGGAAVLVADVVGAGVAIPVIAIGIALTAIVQRRRRRAGE